MIKEQSLSSVDCRRHLLVKAIKVYMKEDFLVKAHYKGVLNECDTNGMMLKALSH
jgi:hypothetical protein